MDEIGIKDIDYSLEALIDAARQESPVTVIDATEKIVAMAETFTKNMVSMPQVSK